MATLYRDYRPQNFSEVLGQKHIKITLQNEIGLGKLAQAFLFCGPRAVGKTTLARVLAKSVNCLEKKEGEFEPCGKCANCLSITAGSNLDIIEIDAASNTGVDNVRDNIISFSRLVPSATKYKVFIIDEVHMLSASAFNALLKIIEEPPTYVIFILCTTEIHKVPLTIISRCERFDFKRISISDIVKKLDFIAKAEKIEIDQEVLEAVARKSGGHLRDAESLLGQIFSLGDKRITLEQAELVIPHYNSNEAVDFVEYLSKKDASKAIALVNSLVDSGANIKNFNSEVVTLVRKMMLSKINPELADNFGLSLGDNLELKVNNILKDLSIDNLLFYAKSLVEAYNEKNQLIAQLPLELAVIGICMGQSTRPVVQVSASSASPAMRSSINPTPVTPIKTAAPFIQKTENTTESVTKMDAAEITTPPADLNPAQDMNYDQLMEKWPEFLVKIKKYNHSLSFVLQNCEPQSVSGSKLCLVFKYKFHLDRVSDAANRNIVENTLSEVFGAGISLNAQLDENLEVRHNKGNTEESSTTEQANPIQNPAQVVPAAEIKETKNEPGAIMDNLLKAFGGEVIN